MSGKKKARKLAQALSEVEGYAEVSDRMKHFEMTVLIPSVVTLLPPEGVDISVEEAVYLVGQSGLQLIMAKGGVLHALDKQTGEEFEIEFVCTTSGVAVSVDPIDQAELDSAFADFSSAESSESSLGSNAKIAGAGRPGYSA